MGIVYEAEQKNPFRKVALKIVRGGHFVDDQDLRMFRREIETLARLTHPNIAALYEAGRTERRPALLHDGAGPRRDARRVDAAAPRRRRAQSGADPRAPAPVRHDLPGRQLRPPARRHPPRPEALEHPRHGRRRQDPRLRPRAHHGCGRGHGDERDGRDPGDAPVHEPGAGPRRQPRHRPEDRRLLARGRPLRAPFREAPVQHARRLGRAGDPQYLRGAADTARPERGPANDPCEGPREGARRPLPERRGPRRGRRAVPRQPADPRAPAEHDLSPQEARRAAPRDGGGGRRDRGAARGAGRDDGRAGRARQERGATGRRPRPRRPARSTPSSSMRSARPTRGRRARAMYRCSTPCGRRRTGRRRRS